MNYEVYLIILAGLTGIISFISFFYALIQGSRLMIYLKKNQYEKWIYLTSFGGIGPGIVNTFRQLTYIYNDEDINNKQISKLKNSLRKLVRYELITTLIFVIIYLILKST